MLGWMKDVMGRKVSPLQALVGNQYKDETEKQALLAAIASDDSIKADELVAALLMDDAAVQQRIGVLFVTRANDAGVNLLMQSAIEADPTARAAAVKALQRVRPDLLKPAVEALLSVKKANAEAMKNSWEVAMDMPPEVSDAFVDRALKEGPPRARFNAITRLIKSRKPDEIRMQLIEAAADREARVRKVAVEVLVQLTGPEVFEALLDRLGGEDNAEIRTIAGGYLQKYIASAPAEMRPSILGRLLLSGDAALQSSLLKALFATGNFNEQLLEILTFCKTILGPQHQNVTEALKTLGDPALEGAVRLLQHTDPDIRVQALLLIERFADPRTSGTLVKLLADGDWWVRIMVCETLGRIKDPRVVEHLTRMLTDSDVKWAAIDAIGNIGGDTAFATLVGLLKDQKPEVRLAAINGLKKIDDQRVDGYVKEIASNDVSMDVRVRAVEIMRERGASGNKGGAAITSAQLTRPIEKLLAFARESGASDLHISPNEPPFLRVNGILQRIEMKPLSPQQTEAFLADVLDPVRRPILEKTGAVDLCYPIPGVGRYRVNVFRQQRGLSAVFRCIPNVAPSLTELGLPKHLDEVNTYHQGIVLLTGPAGAGKSTTLTALVNVVNESRQAHVLSLEDPIEFLHAPKRALVNQREIGRDSRSFAATMRAALREDPDIIVVGEMRDAETIRLALVASETGHLVIATMQTTGAVATIDKLVESFPADEQQQIRVSLSGSMKLIVSQTLVPRADGKGRVGVFEILKSTSPIRNIIREGKTYQLPSAMQIGRASGMQTIDACLEDLLSQGTITLETAYLAAQKKETFEKKGHAKPNAATGVAAVQPQAAAAAEGAAAAAPPAGGGAATPATTGAAPVAAAAAPAAAAPQARPAAAQPGAAAAQRPQQPGAAQPNPQARPQQPGANPQARPAQAGAPQARPQQPGAAPGAARPAGAQPNPQAQRPPQAAQPPKKV